MSLDHYYLLGRSGLRVSRLALGTMNFGMAGFHAAYGKTLDEARPIFDAYVSAGGNLIDTADFYTAGESERIIGQLVAESPGLRDRLVITSKFTNSVDPGDPNAGGNGRKHVIRAVEASLRRLGTDYLDLYLLHTWDRITPVDEVLRTFDDLVTAGKIRYAGLSDVPAWYAARAQTLADANGFSPLVSLQLPYSLVERTVEAEHVPVGLELGLGITAWGPLGSGFLTGKYRAGADGGVEGSGRLTGSAAGAAGQARSAADWNTLAALETVARELDVSMAQLALNWVATQPGVAAAIVGASSAAQLASSLDALSFSIPAQLRARLDEASAPVLGKPYGMFTAEYQGRLVSAGAKVGDKPSGYREPVRNWV
ncbi:aldo/keto reductase [Gryllotalpicola protaetiae]|uniref:Aldo/keto reductase n=1 Tax=Gryllotalpicola protaetiae TaxID=2419771 RepID=A0A387BXL9_9MICO|nr:aldo/keto reductase [Gryllotalpicola protaetiae]AYG03101.1 aldo/keto reductase [Gryllotalpicola protaetiae]